MARLNFSSLLEKPLSGVQQVAGFLNKNIPFGRNNRTQLEMDRVLTRGANINGDQLDFATQNEELIEAQRMGSQPQSMGDRVLSGLKDIASRPETYRNLATIGSILASAQGEHNLANTLSTVSNRIDQGIVREENKAILAAQQAKEAKRNEEKEKLNLEDKYRVEIANNKTIKDTEAINSAVSRMSSVWRAYLKNPNVESKNALDQALVITFNKMMDPGSVVRESEFARTPQGQALLARLQGYSEKMKKGGVGLTDANREEILLISSRLQDGQLKEANKILDNYEKLAKERKLNTENIFTRYTTTPFEPTIKSKPTKTKPEKTFSQKQVDKVTNFLFNKLGGR